MNGKNHTIAGAAAGVATTIAAISVGQYEAALLAIPSAIVGAKLPDMDHKKTKAGRIFNAFRTIVPIAAVALMFMYVYAVIYKAAKLNILFLVIPALLVYALRDGAWFWKHRHGTHTLIIPVVLVIGYLILEASMPVIATTIIALDMGYISHLLADTLTYDGCMLLYPFHKKPIKLTKIKSSEEGKCRVMAIILGVGFIIASILLCF